MLSVACVTTKPKVEIPGQDEWVEGGVIRGITLDRQCRIRPFTKVGIANDNPDDGKPQILGFEPGNVQISRNGEPIWERVYAYLFLKKGEAKMVNGVLCAKR